MIKSIRVVLLSIISIILGLYIPVFFVAIFFGNANYEDVLPYCLLSSFILLVLYLAVEKNLTKQSK